MRIPLFSCLLLALVLSPAISRAADDYTLEIKPQGDNTYILTRWAKTGFARNTDKLKDQALADAAAFCAKRNRELKVLDVVRHRPLVPATGFAYARVTFQALDPNDPALHAPPPAAASGMPASATVAPTAATPKTATDALYGDLMKLDDLRQRGILTEKEFETLKARLIEKAQ